MTFEPSRLSVAPMMDWTDRHFRFFARRFSKKTQLYSEMIAAQAIVFGDAERLLGHDDEENPLILQLGGSDPELLRKACVIANGFGYDGVNLNAGCPSERVSAGKFGAALRLEPALIADCLSAMNESFRRPVSIKTRIAIAEQTPDSDGYDDLCRLAEILAQTGCDEFIIHARKARLKGFTPKQNRERIALRYDLVYRFKRDFPHLRVCLNGDVKSLAEVKEHLKHVDGVMVGRAAYADPSLLGAADREIFGQDVADVTARTAVEEMLPYLEKQMACGVPARAVLRHWLGLFKGCAGAAAWRRELSEKIFLQNGDFKTVAHILRNVIPSA